jgi:LysR family transcriptional regulator, glycine cleavage system transcriptional activator
MARLPPLNALRAFESAARHLSFRQAAAELGVTPTAISHQIRSLEETCGQSLFSRRPRPLRLTPAGELLFPILRCGFDSFTAALEKLSAAAARRSISVTVPNAFAGRWLVPRLPLWRESYPDIALEIIGTNRALNLASGEADVAIRYARRMPKGYVTEELFRDRYGPVCRPQLLPAGEPVSSAAELIRLPRIHYDWMRSDAETPTWKRWWAAARASEPSLLRTPDHCDLTFHEEAHAIDAVLAGQGVAICSDIVLEPELRRGELVKAHPLSLPGYGFWLMYLPEHPRKRVIALFTDWLRAAGRESTWLR